LPYRRYLSTTLFVAGLIVIAITNVPAVVALLMGLALGLTVGTPLLRHNKTVATYVLQVSVVGMGATLSLPMVWLVTSSGMVVTVCAIVGTLCTGWLVGRWFGLDTKTSHLIACGTAICGGSAIAAVAPTIDASEEESSVSFMTVFLLNALALLIFPAIGAWLGMSEHNFGMWAALAIHDTSSVVGAATEFGGEALKVATTAKLARALWIMPVALVSAWVFRKSTGKTTIPWFIVMFVLVVGLNDYIPFAHVVEGLARKGMIVALFVIGAGSTRKGLTSVGTKPFVLGLILWLLVGTATAVVILAR